jgi:hypothetical protein
LSPRKKGRDAQTEQQSSYKDCPSTISAIFIPIGDFIHSYKDEIGATAAVLLAFITAGLVWVGYRQIVTSRAQLRAYVFMEGGSLRLIDIVIDEATGQKARYVEGFIVLKNMGVTPASNHRNWTRIEILPANNPPFDQRSEGFGRGVLAPNGGGMEIQLHQGPVSDADLIAFRDETKRIFVWGEVLYSDVFGTDRYYRYYSWNAKEIPGKGWPLSNADKPHEAS